MGTDIADLLLEGHEPESRAYAPQVVEALANTSVTEDRLSATNTVDVSSVELIDRFRHLLLHGRKKVKTRETDLLTSLDDGCSLLLSARQQRTVFLASEFFSLYAR